MTSSIIRFRLKLEEVKEGGEAILKKVIAYFKAHPCYNSVVHIIAGIGIGALIAYPVIGIHPVRWGIGLLVIAVLGHLYPLMVKEK